jgi:translation initiation factor IF-3
MCFVGYFLFTKFVEMKKNHRINQEITEKEIRIIGENPKNISGVINTEYAIKLAEDMDIDLVEINRNSKPPVCKFVFYDKMLFDEKKKQKELNKINKKNQIKIKEIRLTPNISDNDIEYRIKNIREFLVKKNKIKITMVFKGRGIKHIDLGKITLLKLVNIISDVSVAEYLPKLEGNKLHVIIKPK